jgi:hypothetical protein
MPIVDLLIVALTLALAVWGYRRGLMTNALILIGFFAGALLGSRVAPLVLEDGLNDAFAPVLAIPGALLCGALVAAALERVGFALRRLSRGRDRLNAAGGALLTGVLGLIMVWIVATLVVRIDDLRGSINDSGIVEGLNAVVPSPGPLLGSEKVSYELPVIEGPAARGRPAGAHVKTDPQVLAAAASVAKIRVVGCEGMSGGSGWIAADGIVVTNAHVVENAEQIGVQMEGKGKLHAAQAIWYDGLNDVAILRTPGVRGERALDINTKAKPGTAAALLGFPGGGPYVVKPARLGVISTIPGFRMEGSDFRPERREVMRMISRARPGNSGGPVVDLQGRVVGMVFAHRRGAGYTSYAVPTPIVKSALRRTGPPVDTGSCDEE